MTTKGNTAEGSFWRAIEFAVQGTLERDIADVGRYVASRGPSGIAEFETELARAVTTLLDAGVAEAMKRSSLTLGARPFRDLSEHEIETALHGKICLGREYFGMLTTRPEIASPNRPPRTSEEAARAPVGPVELDDVTDLRFAVAKAQKDPGIADKPLWPTTPGDRQRDGGPWIRVFGGYGIGVSGDRPRMAAIEGFDSRFAKAALLRSYDPAWRALCKEKGIKGLDITHEFWRAGTETEHVEVLRTGSKTALVVYRHHEKILVADDPLTAAEEDADAALEAVWSELAQLR